MGDYSSLGMNLFMIISIYKDARGRHARALLFTSLIVAYSRKTLHESLLR